MTDRLDGKVAIVTGAASGIGHATAVLLAERGAAVAAVDVNGPGLEPVVAELRNRGVKAEAVIADLADEAATSAVVDTAVTGLGRVDILVNAAAPARGRRCSTPPSRCGSASTPSTSGPRSCSCSTPAGA